jgi:hypothetical protein
MNVEAEDYVQKGEYETRVLKGGQKRASTFEKEVEKV